MGLFDLFHKKGNAPKPSQGKAVAQLVSWINSSFDSSEKAELCAAFQNGALTNAKFFSLIRPAQFRKGLKAKTSGGDPIRSGVSYLLNVRPNPGMNAAQFWERVAYDYFFGYAFVYVERDPATFEPTAFWPIVPDETCPTQIGLADNGHYWLQARLHNKSFRISDRDFLSLSYEPPVDLFKGRNKSLDAYMRAIGSGTEGLDKAVKASMALRFIVLGTGVLGDLDAGAESEELSKILGGQNGAAFLGAGNTVHEVQNQGKWPLAPEVAMLEAKVHQYLGVTPAIMQGDFTEAQWASYYSRTIAPLAAKLEAEMNAKLLTPEEYWKGNEWRIGSERLEVVTPNTALKRVELKLKMPIVVTNDLRQDMGEDPIEGGDVPLQNQTYADPSKKDVSGNGGNGRPSLATEQADEEPAQQGEEG